MDAGRIAVVARDVGVRYDLRLTHGRTLRQTLADAVTRSRAVADGESTFWALDGVTFVAERGDVIEIGRAHV